MVPSMTTKKRPEAAPAYLTVPEAASQLRVGVSTLRGWIAQGVVEVAKPGRSYLIPQREVDRMLAPRRRA